MLTLSGRGRSPHRGLESSRSGSRARASSPAITADDSTDEEATCPNACALCARAGHLHYSCCLPVGHAGSCSCAEHRVRDTRPLATRGRTPLVLAESAVDKTTSKLAYGKAISTFGAWLLSVHMLVLTDLVLEPERLDDKLREYIQGLWDSRKRVKGHLKHLMSALRDRWPRLKGVLPLASRDMVAWERNDPGDNRVAWPTSLMLAVAHLAYLTNRWDVALTILLSAHCFLRPGEPPLVRHRDIQLDLKCLSRTLGLVSLTKPKSRSRGSRLEHVTIENHLLLACLRSFLSCCTAATGTSCAFPTYKDMGQVCKILLDYLAGPGHPFTLHGLRGGGATLWFLETGNVPEVLRRGRWASERTLTLYLQVQAALSSSWPIDSARWSRIEALAAPWEPLLRPRLSN